MKRIAILGGGISGLTAAYKLEKRRLAGEPLDWHLYEASDRLGGTIQTTRITNAQGGEFILEGGPDGWVSDKPWLRDLAVELGLEDELIGSNDETRITYIARDGKLIPTPSRMRMMVPDGVEALAALADSPLLSPAALDAYAQEIQRADALKAAAPDHDESVADFILRHFGEEVLTTLAAPLLSGVFGGDVYKLSVRAVMPQFVTMEREHGSLIVAMDERRTSRARTSSSTVFTSFRRGLESLVDTLAALLPQDRVHLGSTISAEATRKFDHCVVALPLRAVQRLLTQRSAGTDVLQLLPSNASSAILITFVWNAEVATTFDIPPGFGFLVPDTPTASDTEPSLLAATFATQKWAHRAPEGARIIRAFYGSHGAEHYRDTPDATLAAAAFRQLSRWLGDLQEPDPAMTLVRHLPNSLPQYEVGHLERIAELRAFTDGFQNLTLLGNSYYGVGLPDLVREAKEAVRKIVTA